MLVIGRSTWLSFELFVKKEVFKQEMIFLLFFEFSFSSVQALMGIKNLLVDPHGVLDNWDEAAVDPCSWNMVTCSTDNLVVSL